jgi:hypothetical protein
VHDAGIATLGSKAFDRPMTQRQSCSCGFGCGPAIRRGLDAAIARSASSFQAVVGREPEGFCCPVCIRELEPRCATRGHYPAASVAGRRWTLICKACNSFLGTAFESDAHRHFTAAKSEVRISSSGLGPIGVSIGWDGPPFVSGTPISIRVPKGVGGNVLERLKSDLSGSDRTLRLFFRGPVPDRVRLAVVSWAFLAAFAQYGYAFALNRVVQTIRLTLLAPDEIEIRPTMVLWRHGRPLGKGHPALILAIRPKPLEVRLVALAFDFDLAIGVLPLAHDTANVAYGDLEAELVSSTSPWLIRVEAIERFIPEGAQVLFDSTPHLVTGPYLVIGLTPGEAEAQLRDGRLEPPARRLPRSRMRVSDEPPGEIPHRLSRREWDRLGRAENHGDRHRADLFEVSVKGRDPIELQDVSDRNVRDEITRLRSRFPLGGRPQILYRGQLIRRAGRELLWQWGTIFWPDGTQEAIGPFFTRAAFMEAAERRVLEKGACGTSE